MTLQSRYPAFVYLREKARRRVPYFAWEYLVSGNGAEHLVDRKRAAFDAIDLASSVAQGRYQLDTRTMLFGQEFSVPFGASPAGMSGLIWRGAELILTRAARENRFPDTLSMVANETPEAVASAGGENVWFQLYPLNEPEIEDDLLERASGAGIRTLVVTLDVPVGTRRERQLAAGLTVPPKVTPLTIWRVARRPHWAMAVWRHGQLRFRMLEKYFPTFAMADSAKLVGTIVDGRPDWNTVERLRKQWKGNLVVKGLLSPHEAERAIACGADGVVVSNHGGRQFGAASPSIYVLPAIADKVASRVPIIFDSGILWGLDILRALSHGANFCLLGRGFLYAVAALGELGGSHVYSILKRDLEVNMIQKGVRTLAHLRLALGAPSRVAVS